MPTVAIAGGTGKLGRTILDAILKQGGHEVVLLSRAGNDAKEKELGARIVAVDYNDIASLTKSLEEQDVHTVISTLDSTAGPEPEFALIKAADASKTTKRFIPCWWGTKYTTALAAIFSVGHTKILIRDAIEKTNLEYTVVINGYFTDYFVPKIPSHMGPFTMFLDIPNNKAALPGSGNVPASFTHTLDVAVFTAKLLNVPNWPKEAYIIGETLTWNEVLAAVEEAKGVKFDVTYDPLEKLEKGEVTELPGHKDMYPFFPKEALQKFNAVFGVAFEKGFLGLQVEQRLTDVKAKTVRELVAESWKA